MIAAALKRHRATAATFSVSTALALFAGCATTDRDAGFVDLFNGRNLDGWQHVGKGSGYVVKDGMLICPKGGGGKLFSEKQYADFVLRLDFRLEAGGNNGIAIRCPLSDNAPHLLGTEIQILDDNDPKYSKLKPAQYCGSIYDVIPPKRGAVAAAGQWNSYEITYRGRRARVVLNGKVIVNANLNDVTDAETLTKHPGLLRDKGHVGFLGHGDQVEFRNIRIKELPVIALHNVPPEGFERLYTGRDLEGWRGALKGKAGSPPGRAALPKDELGKLQKEADDNMRAHWHPVAGGDLIFDGKGRNLVTARDYADYELLVDWKIAPLGDSGIYLRGQPQVQIWDREDKRGNPKRLGSGGLYNNQKNPTDPLVFADHAPGDWNRFRILMIGEKVHVFLNSELVVNNTTLENYFERGKPLPATGPIELQNHGNTLWFRNVFIREIKRGK
ncbi:MAG: DUF1080 domain-containing protein [Verrucomicrobia bacterium]|nr:DUF1080 domain-containing protein [Verrucomicrobiota bacterium]